MTAKVTHEREYRVSELLLTRHRMLLVKALVTRISSRLIYLMNAAFVLLIAHLTWGWMVAPLIIAFFVYLFWSYEEQVTLAQIERLEDAMAKRSEEEDLFIRSVYIPSKYTRADFFLRFEPLFWLVLIMVLIALRFFSG